VNFKIIKKIIIAILALGLISVFILKYIHINNNNSYLGVTKKILITKNTTIKAHNLNFKIKDYKVIPTKDKLFVGLDVEIQKTGALNFSFKENNTNFFDNMYVSSPYYTAPYNPSIEELNSENSKMNINLFNQGKLSTVHLTFEINKKFYNLKTKKLIYYFLVPTDGLHKYTKYYLPLIY
jgi:outer membrane protein assembly factor BamA